jgi:predicted MFS family arabinose efflux permease
MPPAARPLVRLVFLELVAFGIVLPLLPGTATRLGSGAVLAGVVVATDSLMQFLFAPWWGRLSDRAGRRPVLLLGLAGSVAAYLLFGIAGSIGVLLLSRVVAGATGSTFHVAQAYVADLTEPSRRGHAMGVLGAAFGVGFTVGPALGALASRWGDAAPGLLATSLALVNFVIAWRTLPESRVRRPPDVARRRIRLTGAPPAVLAAGFAITLAFTAMYVVFPLWCQEVLGLSRGAVSGLFVVVGLVTLIVQGRAVGRLAARYGERPVIAVGALALAAGFATLPFAESEPARTALLVTGVVVLTVGFSLATPGLAAHLSRTTADDAQGSALGALQSVSAMARIVGPPLAGLLGATAGLGVPFFAAAGAAVTGAGLTALLRAPPRWETPVRTAELVEEAGVR